MSGFFGGGGGGGYVPQIPIITGAYYPGLASDPFVHGSPLDKDIIAVPFLSPASATFNRIGMVVDAANTAAMSARLGIYADNGAVKPGALILDAGQIDLTGFSTELAISQALSFGTLYWLVFFTNRSLQDTFTAKCYQSQTGTKFSISPMTYLFGIGNTSFPQFQQSFQNNATYGALPDPFPLTGAGWDRSDTAPTVYLRKV